MKCTAAANSVSDMVHDAAAAHPSAAVVGMVAWDCEGGQGSAPNAHRPFRLMSKTDGSRSIPALQQNDDSREGRGGTTWDAIVTGRRSCTGIISSDGCWLCEAD